MNKPNNYKYITSELWRAVREFLGSLILIPVCLLAYVVVPFMWIAYYAKTKRHERK